LRTKMRRTGRGDRGQAYVAGTGGVSTGNTPATRRRAMIYSILGCGGA
jgi:hypothetical protein